MSAFRAICARFVPCAGLLAAPVLAGCPSDVPTPTRVAPTEAKADLQDPRVMTLDGEHYARPGKGEHAEPAAPADGRAPGSGATDETNGVCRLFAPKLPDPECCKAEWGFDAMAAAEACGLDVYLGESFQMSCGYYFQDKNRDTRWFRMSGVPGDTPADAAASHDKKVARLYQDPAFKSVPVPGVPGALWSHKDRLNWAFLPGWSMVRLFTWKDDSCDREQVFELLKTVVAAKQPASGAPRRGLIPLARK